MSVYCQYVALNVKGNGYDIQVVSFRHFLQNITAVKLVSETVQEKPDGCGLHLSFKREGSADYSGPYANHHIRGRDAIFAPKVFLVTLKERGGGYKSMKPALYSFYNSASLKLLKVD